jgi:hypothetical protein
MSFATLMAHVEVEPKSGGRVRLAAQMADRFASTLIGISACVLPPYPAEGAYFVTRISSARSIKIFKRPFSAPRPPFGQLQA